MAKTAFIIDEAFLPATLTSHQMTDEEFVEFCGEHPDLFFEMTAEGEIIVMPPTYSKTGAQNLRILGQLDSWAQADASGVATDSSTGFLLPNGARRSPDAAWTSKIRLKQLSKQSLDRFWHLGPDFVIELKSQTDRLRVVREKMLEWMANGAQLAWLIDPGARTVEVYRPHRQPELLTDIELVEGEGPVRGFVLQLSAVWDPLGL